MIDTNGQGFTLHEPSPMFPQETPASKEGEEPIQSIEDGGECQCKRVLIVDDNDYNIFTLTKKLAKRGYEVVSAQNGMLAIDAILLYYKNPESKCRAANCRIFRCIFMDIDMPIMNGLECTRKLSAMKKEKRIPDIPILGCSAFDQEEDIREGILAGMVSYIPKPVFDDKLDQALKTIN
jgi:CheY-like chemotaxis protein